jgi:hypothetical protein
LRALIQAATPRLAPFVRQDIPATEVSHQYVQEGHMQCGTPAYALSVQAVRFLDLEPVHARLVPQERNALPEVDMVLLKNVCLVPFLSEICLHAFFVQLAPFRITVVLTSALHAGGDTIVQMDL